MNFHRHQTAIESFAKRKRSKPSEEFRKFEPSKCPDDSAGLALTMEWAWHQVLNRPFCRVFPPVLRMIQHTNLAIPCDALTFPRDTEWAEDGHKPVYAIAFEFPVGHEHLEISSFVVGIASGDEKHLVSLSIHRTLRQNIVFRSHLLRTASLEEAMIRPGFLESAEACGEGQYSAVEIVSFCLRTLAVFCFADQEHEDSLLRPMVLSKDRHREVTPELLAKARRRGVHGYEFGAGIEISPHYRRPHFAIRWTGPGATVPKLRPVKQCFVNRRRLKVPEGHHDA